MRSPAVALVFISFVVAACSPLASPAPEATGPVIAIASEFPLSDAGEKGAERAVAAAVAGHPTLRGYRLAYLSLDDNLAGRFDQDRALQNASSAIADHRVLGIVGPWNSSIASLLLPIAGHDDLVMISPSATADCLTARPKACLQGATAPAVATNFFRIAARNTVAARTAADFAVDKLGIGRFAVLRDRTGYGRVLSNAFKSEVAALGAQAVFSGSFSDTDPSYAPLLRQAQAAGAEALFVGGLSDLGACRVRGAMSGIFPDDAYFISGDGILDPTCITDAGQKADEHLIATVSAREPQSVPAGLKGLVRGKIYDAYNSAAYDCAQILIAAIDHAIQVNNGKIPTREQVLRAVAATTDFNGITGTYTFDANGDAVRPAVSFYYVRDGAWTFWQNAPVSTAR